MSEGVSVGFRKASGRTTSETVFRTAGVNEPARSGRSCGAILPQLQPTRIAIENRCQLGLRRELRPGFSPAGMIVRDHYDNRRVGIRPSGSSLGRIVPADNMTAATFVGHRLTSSSVL